MIYGIIGFMVFWFCLAKLWAYWGFMKEDKEVLREMREREKAQK